MLERLTCHWRQGNHARNASARPARSTDAGISFGTTVHGLPASTDVEITFGTSAHGLPAYLEVQMVPGV